MKFRLTLFALCLVLCPPVFADEAATPAPVETLTPAPSPSIDPKEQASLQSFAAAHPECMEWSDGCAVCKREEAGASHCSTPGIACQPTEVACAQTRP